MASRFALSAAEAFRCPDFVVDKPCIETDSSALSVPACLAFLEMAFGEMVRRAPLVLVAVLDADAFDLDFFAMVDGPWRLERDWKERMRETGTPRHSPIIVY